MFIHIFELSSGIKASTLILVLLPKCDPWPFVFIAMDSALWAFLHVLDNVDCNMPFVCENAFMSVYPHACDDMLHESMGVVVDI